MKSDAVNSWIGHWLKIQKKNKHPLVLKNGSDSKSDKRANPITVSWRRRNKGKGQYIECDDSEDEASANNEMADEANDGGSNVNGHGTRPNAAGKNGKGASTARDTQGTRHDCVEEGKEDRAISRNADGARSDSTDKVNNGGSSTNGLPPSPSSVATNRQSHRDFLHSLSDNRNYQKLLLLLHAAEVCDSILACALSKPFPEGRPVQGNTTSMGNVEVQ